MLSQCQPTTKMLNVFKCKLFQKERNNITHSWQMFGNYLLYRCAKFESWQILPIK